MPMISDTVGISFIHGGEDVKFHNPWPGRTLALYRNGAEAGTLSGTDITLTTSVNEVIHVAPHGTSYSTILNLMAGPGSGRSYHHRQLPKLSTQGR